MQVSVPQVKGTKQLKLDPLIYDALQKEKVLPGDVIYIEANSGALVCRNLDGVIFDMSLWPA